MPQVTLSDEYLDAAQSLIYRAWTVAFDNLKHCKAEVKDRNEPDWEQMHAIRLANAEKDFAKWSALRDESIPVSPLTRNR